MTGPANDEFESRGSCLTNSGRLIQAETHILKGKTVAFATLTPSLINVLLDVQRAAGHDVSILILGETGTGKSTIARLIHELSPRAAQPLVTVDCGAMAEGLIESELFGHVKGAFTGADMAREGKFAAVGSGTMLLDEVDLLPLGSQAKLLRVIENKAFEPIGSTTTRSHQARVLATSNANLEAEANASRFRKDLFYRLNVVALRLPPLRERQQDLLLLAKHYVRHFCKRHQRPPLMLDESAMAGLYEHSWPGNLRELRNCIEHAVLLCRRPTLTRELLPIPKRRDGGRSGPHHLKTPQPR